jgi:hypothetical protein
LPVLFVATKSDKGTARIAQSEIELAMRNSAVASQARPFLYVETSAKNRKFIDDLFVKLVYCVLFDPSKVEQKKGPAMQAAQKLVQIEEMRRAQKPPLLPSKPMVVSASPRLSKTNSSTELSRSSGAVATPARSSAGAIAAVAISPPKSDFERQFDAISVSAPTGFRHLRSAADVLKEFDPDFASKQKRPAAIPIVWVEFFFILTFLTPTQAQAQASLRGSAAAASAASSMTSPKVAPKMESVLQSMLSPREQQLMGHMASQLMHSSESSPTVSPRIASPRSPKPAPGQLPWTQSTAKYAAVNGTVFCRVETAFAAEKEGDLSAECGDVLALNENQDFCEEYWYGAKIDETVGYFPQVQVTWIQEP